MVPQNLGTVFKNTVDRFPHKTALLYKDKARRKYLAITWSQFAEKVERAASALLANGVREGDRIAILSENRPEWVFVDMAACCIGAVTVPIYTSLAPAEIQYLLADSGSVVLVASNQTFLEKLAPIQKSLPLLREVVALDPLSSGWQNPMPLPVRELDDFMKQALWQKDFWEKAEQISGDSAATIIYTSGTTGFPKGVLLTHRNFIHNMALSRQALRMSETDVHLSFLPLSHVFERMAGYYLLVLMGATIAYAESMDAVPQNLLEVRPSFLLGVPRFYEKIKRRIEETVDGLKGPAKRLFAWSRAIGSNRRRACEEGRLLSFWEGAGLWAAERLVYRKIRKQLGGRVQFCVSGGAPLPKETAEFFYDLGVLILEGYGLTETAPVISVNRMEKFKFGTVGIPLEGIEVKITEEGEIITRSPCVMKGYYGLPKETEEALKEGWLYTGDLGSLDAKGFLSITGRKKELIVTSGGKKVAPRPIEEWMEKDEFILRCVLYGEGRRYLTALIVPRKERMCQYAALNRIPYASYEELLKDARASACVARQIEARSKDFASFEKIKYFALIPDDFTQEAGELTPTLKVKRGVVLKRYEQELLKLYQEKGC
ncbi:MAG: long-chain fatty acid--CoA ligase [Candidatus Omnitrophica bacterium]|nr:long-chain fatty acid--CoA ligase [Candidatus Omnitrophota bacterium]